MQGTLPSVDMQAFAGSGFGSAPLFQFEIIKNLLDLLGASPNKCFLVGPVLEEALRHLQIKQSSSTSFD
jgi:hypothetical protein